MTNKRFTIKEIDNFSYGIKVTDIILDKDGIELPQSTVCDLLNKLVKENEYLHEYNTKLQKQPLLFDVQTIPNTMEIIEANTQLEKENEELRKEKNDVEVKLYSANENILMQMDYNEIIKQNTKEIISLKQENKQLKQQVGELKKEIVELSNGEADWIMEEYL